MIDCMDGGWYDIEDAFDDFKQETNNDLKKLNIDVGIAMNKAMSRGDGNIEVIAHVTNEQNDILQSIVNKIDSIVDRVNKIEKIVDSANKPKIMKLKSVG